MKADYADWIAAHVPGNPIGLCKSYAEMMAEDFPELTVVRGHYHCPDWGRRGHWWCKTADGVVIDPTAAQFPSLGIGEYEEHIEGSPEPTGKCLNCGEYTWDERNFCNDACADAMVASINAEMRR